MVNVTPTISQLKGMVRFHQKAYKAYKAAGMKSNAIQAREKMLMTYLDLRKIRNGRPLAKYHVSIGALQDPSDFDFTVEGDYVIPLNWIPCDSFGEASAICMAFIEYYNLGAGSFAGGQIVKGAGLVAEVSYNGRIWKADKNPAYRVEIKKEENGEKIKADVETTYEPHILRWS